MNKVILMGRLTRDPDVRYSQGESATAWLLEDRLSLLRNICARERR